MTDFRITTLEDLILVRNGLKLLDQGSPSGSRQDVERLLQEVDDKIAKEVSGKCH